MDENEEKLEEIKRAFIDKIESIRTILDMINLVKNISPQGVKNFIKNELQGDVDNQSDAITHIEGKIIFKQDLISEIDNI